VNVLIGVDGSEGSHEAVRQVGRLLAGGRDRVALYYRPPRVDSDPSGSRPDLAPRLRDTLAEGVFGRAIEFLPASLRANVETIIGSGSPAAGLVAAAEQWPADLIAVGARGIGPIKRLLVGSVSTTVARTARIPVLVARPATTASGAAGGTARVSGTAHDDGGAPPSAAPPAAELSAADPAWRVLLATDGSDESRRAGPLLADFAWPPTARGWVMTVIEALLAGQVPDWLEERARDDDVEAMAQAWINEHEEEKEAARRELAAYRANLPPLFHAEEPIVAEGHVSEQILAAIAREGIHLVVVGAQGKTAWQRLVIGSTSETLLTHAPCSVLIVR
jgi:nucleotide-binding universal stress UspA family protein